MDKLGENEMCDHAKKQCESLLQKIETAPKSMKWKIRASVGEKNDGISYPKNKALYDGLDYMCFR